MKPLLRQHLALISAHLNTGHIGAHSKTVISKTDLVHLYSCAKVEEGPFAAKNLLVADAEDKRGGWVFQDENVATFLIRSCLGGDNEWERRRVLSLKEDRRAFMDNITVT